MVRFLGVLVLIAIVVACIGLYLGWFRFDSENVDGKTHIILTVDKDKFKSDEQKAIDKVKGQPQPQQ